jgi:hypothetical protein
MHNVDGTKANITPSQAPNCWGSLGIGGLIIQINALKTTMKVLLNK